MMLRPFWLICLVLEPVSLYHAEVMSSEVIFVTDLCCPTAFDYLLDVYLSFLNVILLKDLNGFNLLLCFYLRMIWADVQQDFHPRIIQCRFKPLKFCEKETNCFIRKQINYFSWCLWCSCVSWTFYFLNSSIHYNSQNAPAVAPE